jgi:hypothetical protein
MKRTGHTLRIFTVLVVVVASLALAAAASARPLGEDGGAPVAVSSTPVDLTTNDSGFNWGDALVGAGVAAGAALALGAAAYMARTRSRLAT